jgi:hypothetical protein
MGKEHEEHEEHGEHDEHDEHVGCWDVSGVRETMNTRNTKKYTVHRSGLLPSTETRKLGTVTIR